MTAEGDHYTAQEAARVLKVTDARIRQMLLAGELEGNRDNSGRWWIPAHAVHDRERPPRVERRRFTEATDATDRLRELQEKVESLQYELGRSQARAELTEKAESTLRETWEQEHERTEREYKRAEEERQRADEERQRAERLQMELNEARLPWWRKLFR